MLHSRTLQSSVSKVYYLLSMIQPIAKKIRPYLEVARLDRPVGIPIIVFPYLYGFFFAILTTKNDSLDQSHLIYTKLPLLVISGTVLRCLGCAWNDIVDIDVDRRVQRTRGRPLARGAISVKQALSFTTFLLVAWVSSLQPLLLNIRRTGLYTIPLIIFVWLYPFAKRVSNYAQTWLGLTLGWGVLVGAAVADQDILNDLLALGSNHFEYSLSPRNKGLLALYLANIIWAVVYDTIYAFQDASDDRKIGVKSMALQLERWAKPSLGLLALGHTSLLVYVGRMILDAKWNVEDVTPYSHDAPLAEMMRTATGDLGFGPHHNNAKAQLLPYEIFTVAFSAAGLSLALILVNLQSPKSCGFWFKHTSVSLGSCALLGFVLQYMWWRWGFSHG